MFGDFKNTTAGLTEGSSIDVTIVAFASAKVAFLWRRQRRLSRLI